MPSVNQIKISTTLAVETMAEGFEFRKELQAMNEKKNAPTLNLD